MSVNKVILLGNVGQDPEMRYPEPDSAIARLTLATNERQPGSDKEITDWHTLILFGNLARVAEKYVRKGSKIYVEGKLKYREYDDRMKIHRRVAEIIVDRMELLGRPQQQG